MIDDIKKFDIEEQKHMKNSPSLERMIVEHDINIEQTKLDNTWRSGCYKLDKNAVQYFTTISIICSVMSFCVYKLSSDTSCEAQNTYISLLTLLLGLLSPSPMFKNK
jgi:hypothetical protein